MALSERKRFLYKVYTSAGTFISVWNDVISDFTYSQQLNTAGSAVEVVLGRTSETINPEVYTRILEDGDTRITEEGATRILFADTTFSTGGDSDVALNNKVEVYAFFGDYGQRLTEDGDTRITESGDIMMVEDGAPNGRLIFTGYISKIVSRFGTDETTRVTLMSHGAEMDNYVLEDGSNTTVTYSSYDPSNILKDVLDKFTAAGGLADYSTTSVQDTATTVSYTFRVNTILEAVQKCVELSPTDWFWRYDMANNIIYLNSRPTTPSHYFVKGKHIREIELEQHIEDLVNTVYFTGAETAGVNLFNKYTDATSISTYRRGLNRITDNRVTTDTAAEIISESEIERYKDPIYRTQITIQDKVYRIEDIELGQLVGFRNFGNFIDTLTMQVVGISYSPDAVTLELDSLLPRVSKRVEDIKRNLQQKEYQNNPTAP